jgi:hypothetical protein
MIRIMTKKTQQQLGSGFPMGLSPHKKKRIFISYKVCGGASHCACNIVYAGSCFALGPLPAPRTATPNRKSDWVPSMFYKFPTSLPLGRGGFPIRKKYVWSRRPNRWFAVEML